MLLSKSSSSKDYFRSGLKAIGFVTKNEALDKKNFGPINVVHIPSKLLDVRNAKYWIPKNVKEAKAIQNTVSELGFDIDISPLTNFRAGLLDTEDKDGINRAADEMASMWGDYLKQIKPKTHCLIETKLNKHEKFLANMLLLIDANTSSGYSRYFDFVQFHTVEDNSKLVWKSHRQVPRKKEMVHLGKTLAKFESLTQRDLKSDNVDAVLKRAICFISMLLFKSTKMKPKNFSEEPDYKTDHELELGFTPGKIKHFSYQDFSRLRIILTKILLLIGNYDFIDYFFKLDPSLFSSEILTDLILEKVRDGQLNDASEYLAALKKNERFSSKITMLEEELARAQKIKRIGGSTGIDASKLDSLSGIDFEDLLSNKFMELGFKTRTTPKTGDFGADIILESKNESVIIVQCKRYKSKVNLKAVQEVIGAMSHYGGDYGIVVTNNGFLNSAIKLAESADVELWDGSSLLDFLSGDISFSELKEL